jgi:hypothetical protein
MIPAELATPLLINQSEQILRVDQSPRADRSGTSSISPDFLQVQRLGDRRPMANLIMEATAEPIGCQIILKM